MQKLMTVCAFHSTDVNVCGQITEVVGYSAETSIAKSCQDLGFELLMRISWLHIQCADRYNV